MAKPGAMARITHIYICGLVATCSSPCPAEVPLHGETGVQFADVKKGQEILTARDRYLTSLSPFDRQSRAKSGDDVSLEGFTAFLAGHVKPWTDDEVTKLTAIVGSIRARLEQFSVPFPKTVWLVKTSGKEEGGAAYCRGNAIVLPQRVVDRPKSRLERLMIHELFHILSANNEPLRWKLYGIIGFARCQPVDLPPPLRDRKITNPDGPLIDSFIELKSATARRRFAPVLFASANRYDPKRGGEFFDYLQFRLMEVKQNGDRMEAVRRDGEPVLIEVDREPNTKSPESRSFFEQIGVNTGYIIHPDEILADNFVHMVYRNQKLKTPRIVTELAAQLGSTGK